MKSFGIISGTTEQRIEQIKYYLGFWYLYPNSKP
jgi:hypothetical protein